MLRPFLVDIARDYHFPSGGSLAASAAGVPVGHILVVKLVNKPRVQTSDSFLLPHKEGVSWAILAQI